ncbi:hypothetical protein BDR07DRAFT_1377795 [Suillus spraguei]|nr:hypothetical protein BDR07DRAFT_1377795 [Suillus spraguei]
MSICTTWWRQIHTSLVGWIPWMEPISLENVILLGNGTIKDLNSKPSFDALTLENSTSATIFSTKEATEKIIARLASLEPGVMLFGRLCHMLQYRQITLAGVIMAIDAGFLAVQGVGTGMVAESILKGSIIFCVSCMFSGMFAQHFGEKLKTLRFVVSFILYSVTAYYLDQGMTVVIGYTTLDKNQFLGVTTQTTPPQFPGSRI